MWRRFHGKGIYHWGKVRQSVGRPRQLLRNDRFNVAGCSLILGGANCDCPPPSRRLKIRFPRASRGTPRLGKAWPGRSNSRMAAAARCLSRSTPLRVRRGFVGGKCWSFKPFDGSEGSLVSPPNGKNMLELNRRASCLLFLLTTPALLSLC